MDPKITKKDLEARVSDLSEKLETSEAERADLSDRLDRMELERLELFERMDKAEASAGVEVESLGPREVYKVTAHSKAGFYRIGRKFTTDATIFEIDELSEGQIAAIESVPEFLRIDKVHVES